MSGTNIPFVSYSPRASLSCSTCGSPGAWKRISWTLTLSACQYDSLRMIVSCCGLNVPSTNGPVPMPSGFVNVTGSACSDQMCSGTIWVSAIGMNDAAPGSVNENVTCVGESAVTSPTNASAPVRSRAGNSLSMLNVNATSSASKASPSLQLTPSRIVTISVGGSAHSNPVASHGSGSHVYLLATKSVSKR